MTKILLAGVGPIPPESPDRLFAPGLRLWIFAEALAGAGHEVELATLGFGGLSGGTVRHFRMAGEGGDASVARTYEDEAPHEALAAIAAGFGPDAAVGLTDAMGHALARSRVDVPLWFDFLGSPMAERQQQAAVGGDDGGLMAAWRTIVPCLLAGDRFSVCSESQRLALMGELGACGRLNRHTAGCDLAHSIPMGVAFSEFHKTDESIRGSEIPRDAVVVLWAGGFNTWTDIDTLYGGLISAMDGDPKIHFVSFGGAIPGHCEEVYPRFEQMAEGGAHSERFHLMGWREPETVQSAYLEADLAINIDCFSYEGVLGTRSRLMEWMRARLPVVTTELCDLSRILAERELAYTFPIGDSEALGAVLTEAAGDPEARKARADRAFRFLETEYANDRLTEPLLKWAEKPGHAPDIDPRAAHCRDASFVYPDNPLAASQVEWLGVGNLAARLTEAEGRSERLRQSLARLRGSRLVRLFARWKGHSLKDT